MSFELQYCEKCGKKLVIEEDKFGFDGYTGKAQVVIMARCPEVKRIFLRGHTEEWRGIKSID